jgi:hypothetical protein
VIAQIVDLAPDRLGTGQHRIGIALLHDQLFPDLGSGQPGVQASRLERGVGLALPIDDSLDVVKQLGEVFFGAFAATQTKSIEAADAAGQFVHPFADSYPIPPQFTLGAPLSMQAEEADRSRHEQTPIHTSQRVGRRLQVFLDRSCKFHENVLRRRGRHSMG